VSHDSGSTPIAQGQKVLATEVRKLSDNRLKHLSFRVRPQNQTNGLAFPASREPSQRTRSFLFLTLAVLSARRSGHHRILLVAENGQMAIHLPLTEARIGGFSTRTAHPGVLARVGELMSELMGVVFKIENPLLYKTKAQVVSKLCSDHPSLIASSLSCWMTSRLTGNFRHCGDCVPCIVRRIALEANGPTAREWARDIFREPLRKLGEDDTGKRNMIELLEFVVTLSDARSVTELTMSFPELRHPSFDTAKAAAMYQQFSKEALAVFENYPEVKCLI
jgi:7-cyano-7-deazaguanine synthase in queuosine biosynthesis